MKTTFILLAAVAMCAWAASGQADWDPNDPAPNTKWVQLPDPNGWDVNVTKTEVLADDFLCTETGYITDVHLWGSWKDDKVGKLTRVTLGFFTDMPANDKCDYSQPGDLVWTTEFNPCDVGDAFQLAKVACGDDQGWYDPSTGEADSNNHDETWQVNVFLDKILPTDQLFFQQEGTIYWLGVLVETDWAGSTRGTDGEVDGDGGACAPLFGWKTSLDHWNDDATWAPLLVAVQGEDREIDLNWNELRDPCTNCSLDLAFVLTGSTDSGIPEPGTIALAGIGFLGLLARRRRK